MPGDCYLNRKAPRGGAPFSTGRGPEPWHLGFDRIGCLCFTHRLSWAWQGRKGDHVWEKRGSGLDLLGCDSGGPLSTVELPGKGLSWSVEHTPDRPVAIPAGPAAGRPNSRRLRPGQLDALKQSLLGVLRQELFSPGSTREQLWIHGLVSRLLADGSLGARTTGLLALIETPEALEGYLLRAQGQNDAKRRAQRYITAVQEASRLAAGRGWLA